VREQQVRRERQRPHQRPAERPDAGAGVEDEAGLPADDLDAGRVPAELDGVGPGGGDRAADSPERDAHGVAPLRVAVSPPPLRNSMNRAREQKREQLIENTEQSKIDRNTGRGRGDPPRIVFGASRSVVDRPRSSRRSGTGVDGAQRPAA
jgi:hypothetical protein